MSIFCAVRNLFVKIKREEVEGEREMGGREGGREINIENEDIEMLSRVKKRGGGKINK